MKRAIRGKLPVMFLMAFLLTSIIVKDEGNERKHKLDLKQSKQSHEEKIKELETEMWGILSASLKIEKKDTTLEKDFSYTLFQTYENHKNDKRVDLAKLLPMCGFDYGGHIDTTINVVYIKYLAENRKLQEVEKELNAVGND